MVIDTPTGTARVTIPPDVAGDDAAGAVELSFAQAPAAVEGSRGLRAFQITIESGGQPVTQLAKPIVIEFTYTDAELAGQGSRPEPDDPVLERRCHLASDPHDCRHLDPPRPRGGRPPDDVRSGRVRDPAVLPAGRPGLVEADEGLARPSRRGAPAG